jgi:sortase A
MSKKTAPLLLVFLGSILILAVVAPLSYGQIKYWLAPQALLDPTSTSILGQQTIVDYTEPANWFNTIPPVTNTLSKVSFYTISIPKVGMRDEVVEINGDNLKKSALQYPGTALPGTFGNTVIFGHSTTPFLYKPHDPLSVFNPLVKVKIGDEIIINYDGITYRYIVRHTAEVDPEKVEVLAQSYDKYELTLVTCTPLGTYLRRFVARAELVN